MRGEVSRIRGHDGPDHRPDLPENGCDDETIRLAAERCGERPRRSRSAPEGARTMSSRGEVSRARYGIEKGVTADFAAVHHRIDHEDGHKGQQGICAPIWVVPQGDEAHGGGSAHGCWCRVRVARRVGTRGYSTYLEPPTTNLQPPTTRVDTLCNVVLCERGECQEPARPEESRWRGRRAGLA